MAYTFYFSLFFEPKIHDLISSRMERISTATIEYPIFIPFSWNILLTPLTVLVEDNRQRPFRGVLIRAKYRNTTVPCNWHFKELDWISS